MDHTVGHGRQPPNIWKDATSWPSAAVIFVLAVLLLLAVGWVDYVTGVELRVFPLYFLPLTLVSLRLGHRAGLLFAALCALVWLASNRLAGMGESIPHLAFANTAIMLAAFAVVVMLTAAERRSLQRERVLSRTDSLTGLPNARGFHEASSVEIERSARYRHPLTLAFLDLDDFKHVNDRFGHAVGDELLVTVARTLRDASRSSDLVGRLGGDEFAILFPETGCEAAEPALRKLHSQLDEALRRRGWPVTASIGAVSAAAASGVEPLLQQADALMYSVKRSGKDALRCAEARPDAPGSAARADARRGRDAVRK